jgi:putative ABC transport system ATP-binding protein
MPRQAEEASTVLRSDPAIVTMADLRFAWKGANAFSLSVRDFTLSPGKRMLIVGPSGSGKSTFLSLLAGIVTPDAGRLEILGTDMSTLSRSSRDRFRAEHFGIIFQMFNLLPYGSVIDNVVLPLSFAAKRRARAQEKGSVEAEAQRLLSSLVLDGSDFRDVPASRLSVGQQQRVAAARALIGRPEIIIADEPTSALDRDRQIAFLDLLFSEVSAAGSALIMVSHDETLGTRFDHVVRFDEIAVAERTVAP